MIVPHFQVLLFTFLNISCSLCPIRLISHSLYPSSKVTSLFNFSKVGGSMPFQVQLYFSCVEQVQAEINLYFPFFSTFLIFFMNCAIKRFLLGSNKSKFLFSSAALYKLISVPVSGQWLSPHQYNMPITAVLSTCS